MNRDDVLVELLQRLKAARYEFVTVTPATNARVLARPLHHPPALRDVFGWNRPFSAPDVPAPILALMRDANIVEEGPAGLRSTLRVASLGEDLFFHSAYPTVQEDAVFFGPDTYRFVAFARRHVRQLNPRAIVDLGAGSGAGGIALAREAEVVAVTLIDSNPAALALARVNARAAGVSVVLVERSRVPLGAGLVIANPPYMIDHARRTYRDGGALHGGQASLDWARDALGALAPGGALLLYTGAAVVAGTSPLLAAIAEACASAVASMHAEEIDPDVFGEELGQPGYEEVERIAAVGIVIRKAGA